MIKDDITLTIPNPHKNEVGLSLLHRILKQADISRGSVPEIVKLQGGFLPADHKGRQAG